MNTFATKSYNSYEDEAAAKGAQLLAAAYEGQGDEVVRIVEESPELLRVGDPVGDTAMHVLARADNVDAIHQLIVFLQEGHHNKLLSTVAKQRNGNGETPFQLAVNEAASLLIEEEEEEEEEEEYAKNRNTTLHVAMETLFLWTKLKQQAKRHCHVSKCLLSDIEMSQIMNKLKLDKRVIEHKFDEGNTVFHEAASSGKTDRLTTLVDQLKTYNNTSRNMLLERNDNSNTALHLALLHGHTTAADYLIQAEPQAAYHVNNKGESPLFLAIKKRNLSLLEALLERLPSLIN